MTQDMLTLDFDKIIEHLQAHAVSPLARKKLADTAPIMNEGLCKARMEETTAALYVMKNAGSPPLAEMEETGKNLTEAAQGGMLLPEQLSGVARSGGGDRRQPTPWPTGRPRIPLPAGMTRTRWWC